MVKVDNRDDWEWLFTFPFPPFPCSQFPFLPIPNFVTNFHSNGIPTGLFPFPFPNNPSIVVGMNNITPFKDST